VTIPPAGSVVVDVIAAVVEVDSVVEVTESSAEVELVGGLEHAANSNTARTIGTFSLTINLLGYRG